MITKFRLENFKAHRDTQLALRPFTLLVGDNSSGKPSVLEALVLPGTLAAAPSAVALNDLIHRGAHQGTLSFKGTMREHPWNATVSLGAPGHHALGATWALRAAGSDPEGAFDSTVALGTQIGELQRIIHLTGRTRLYRFNADRIAASAYSDQPDAAIAENGELTAVSLASLKLADDERFDRVETAMRRLVPSLRRVFIKSATLKHPSNPNPVTGSKLHFDFQGATGIPAEHASQGTLVALAQIAVLHEPRRPSLILLDDFDHSLHPRAQIELVRISAAAARCRCRFGCRGSAPASIAPTCSAAPPARRASSPRRCASPGRAATSPRPITPRSTPRWIGCTRCCGGLPTEVLRRHWQAVPLLQPHASQL